MVRLSSTGLLCLCARSCLRRSCTRSSSAYSAARTRACASCCSATSSRVGLHRPCVCADMSCQRGARVLLCQDGLHLAITGGMPFLLQKCW